MGNSSLTLKQAGIALFAWSAVGINGAIGAYLPALGPAPLRFQSPPAFVATVSMLPPLRSAEAEVLEPEPAVTNEAAAAEPPVVQPAAPAVSAERKNTLAEAVPPVESAPPPPPVEIPATPIVTPQMLIEYFRPSATGTNAGTSVIIPGAFLPPQSAPPSSSAATYNVK
jgi:hypothetical protein